jgi:hypothetical protein
MRFGFYPGMFMQATRSAATFLFLLGLTMVGMAILICFLPELIGYIVAALLMLAGVSFIGYAIRLWLATIGHAGQSAEDDHDRHNVRIRIENHQDDLF